MSIRQALSSLAPIGRFTRAFFIGFALRTARDLCVGLLLGAVAGVISYLALRAADAAFAKAGAAVVGLIGCALWLALSRPAAMRAGVAHALRALGIGDVFAQAVVEAAFPEQAQTGARVPLAEVDRRIRTGALSAMHAVAPRWLARPLAWAVGRAASRAVLRRVRLDPAHFDALDTVTLRRETARVIEGALAWCAAP